mgnify:CR=1 FL=1
MSFTKQQFLCAPWLSVMGASIWTKDLLCHNRLVQLPVVSIQQPALFSRSIFAPPHHLYIYMHICMPCIFSMKEANETEGESWRMWTQPSPTVLSPSAIMTNWQSKVYAYITLTVSSKKLGCRQLGCRQLGCRQLGCRQLGGRQLGGRQLGGRQLGYSRYLS